MANETLGARRGGFRLVVGTEVFGMELGLDEASMARGRRAGPLLHVAGLAVGHPEIGGNGLVVVVTLYTVHHFGKRKVAKAGARGHGVVARGAIQVELLPAPEVSDVTEFQVDPDPGNDVRRDHAALLREPRVFDFLGRVASTAIGGRGIGAQRRLHPGLRVALGALSVARESGKHSLRIELMAERAVCPKAGFRVDPPFGIDVARVGELEQNCALLFVSRKGEQCVRARGREAGVALIADFLIQVRAKSVGVTRHTLIVAGALKLNRPGL